MIVLGIETSCDETSAALVQDGHQILCERTLSQIKIHAPYGGVVPEIASRTHVETLHHLVQELFQETRLTPQDVDLLAATHCPGLMGALLVGVHFINGLALAWEKPVVGINHLEAHLYAATMHAGKNLQFPSLVLLVSGGHTQLISMEAIGKYQLLGSTLDDAVGEAFDKTAKLLGLPYPGGPQIEQWAKKGNPRAYHFPRGMRRHKTDLRFSFSGLKTAVRYQVEAMQAGENTSHALDAKDKADIAASFQQAAIESLCIKTRQALEQEQAFQSLIVCGGVAANSALQDALKSLAKSYSLSLWIPPLAFCTDNAVMVAGLAYHKQHEAGESITEVKARKSLC